MSSEEFETVDIREIDDVELDDVVGGDAPNVPYQTS